MEKLKALYEAEAERLAGISDGMGDYLHPVFGEGPENPAAVLIGEAPGGDEARRGRPFVGKAGKQLDSMLLGAGIDRGKIYVTNAVKFRPVNIKPKSVSNRTPSLTELKAGLSLLEAELEILKPRIIITLGNTPLSAVLALGGQKASAVGTAHGRPVNVTIKEKDYILFPQYHPASVIYNRALAAVLEEDMLALGKYLKRMEKR